MNLPPEFNSWDEVWDEHQLRGQKLRDLEGLLTRHGFRRCDVPACNCGSWHRDKHPAMRALESLTPGGSEFVDDPQRCLEFVQETIKRQKREIDELRARLAL